MFWTAFLLGTVGSLHCAAMCGPLVLAVPAPAPGKAAFVTSRVIYNFGRVMIYAVLGLLFGTIGKSLRLAGLQRWLSILTGAAMITFLLVGHKGAGGPF